MSRTTLLKHEFVEYIPAQIAEGTIYISIEFATAVHKCCCGCGNEVVTPITPTDWQLTFDGETISLHPSIGNWNFDCQSHYWIRHNKVTWAPRWSRQRIDAGREQDRVTKATYYDPADNSVFDEQTPSPDQPPKQESRGLWRKLKKRIF